MRMTARNFSHRIKQHWKEIDVPAANQSRGAHAGIASRIPVLYLWAAALSLHSLAIAGDNTEKQEIETRYRNERAACESRSPAQDRAVCLREAAAAREAALRGQLGEAQGNYEQNALARCEALPPAERDICRRRTRGEGETKGSVTEGGIYREYREINLPSAAPPKDMNAR
jgi:hypothetical protein